MTGGGVDLRELIRSLPDYPKPGIVFRDITTLLQDKSGFRRAVDELIAPFQGHQIDKVAGIEARGFIVGGAVAYQLSVGFIPVRKQGKLPWHTIAEEYELEYGSDQVEIHTDMVSPDEKVLLIDDLIATGGTAEAAIRLLERSGAVIAGCSFIVDLPDLGGAKKLEAAGYDINCVVAFEGH